MTGRGLGYIVGVGRPRPGGRRQHTEYRVPGSLFAALGLRARGACVSTLRILRTYVQRLLAAAHDVPKAQRLEKNADDVETDARWWLSMIDRDAAARPELLDRPACVYVTDYMYRRGDAHGVVAHEREHARVHTYETTLPPADRAACEKNILRTAQDRLPGFKWAYARGEVLGWWLPRTPVSMQVDEVLARAEEIRTVCSKRDRRQAFYAADHPASLRPRIPYACRELLTEFRDAMQPGRRAYFSWATGRPPAPALKEDLRAVEAVAFALDAAGGAANWWRKACPPSGKDEE